jgi:hypothetical protein
MIKIFEEEMEAFGKPYIKSILIEDGDYKVGQEVKCIYQAKIGSKVSESKSVITITKEHLKFIKDKK